MSEVYELTDENKLDIFDTLSCGCSEVEILDAGAKAQAKKLLKWGISDCKEHDHINLVTGEKLTFKRFRCILCMQPILKAHEIEE